MSEGVHFDQPAEQPERELVDRLSGPGRADRSLILIAKAAEALNQPIRIRFTLSLLDPKSGQYKGWRGQNWKVPVRGIDEAHQVQELMELLFDIIDLAGLTWSIEVVQNAKQAVLAMRNEE